jgi:NDP-sugar pyrophosphorylase family protein
MKAMIFAAGLGTRLKPLTNYIPKALVEVGGKPLIQHTIEKLKESGFDEIIINIHHFANQIIEFIESKNSFNIRIEFSDESKMLLDTGGGIKHASHFFNDGKPFLVHNVDIISNIDLNELYSFHSKSFSVATLVCSERKTSRYLLFDTLNQLKGWRNNETGKIKSPLYNIDPTQYRELAFSGIHIIEPSIFKYMIDFPEKFSIIDFYILLSQDEKINAFTTENQLIIDVGKPNTLEDANSFFLS